MSSSKLSPLVQLLNVLLSEAHLEKKYRLGLILTIIDASITDPEQRKAMKDLICDRYWPSSLNDSFRRAIKNILFQFSEKFCQDLTPKTDEDLWQFDRKTKEVMPPSDRSYFN